MGGYSVQLFGVSEMNPDALRCIRTASLEEYSATAHQHFELIYIRHGKVSMQVDGYDTTLGPGDLTLISPFVPHSCEHSRSVTADIFLFSPQICPEVSRLFMTQKPAVPVLRRTHIPPVIHHLLRSMAVEFLPTGVQESQEQSITTLEYYPANLYFSVVLLELSKVMPMTQIQEGNLSAFHRILAYCANNYLQDISRESVASACDVSPSTVSQTFARLNTTFREYINDLRITRAHHLLCNTKTPITEIIYECGYSNQGTFNRNFFTKYGHSPRELRSQRKK